MVRCTVVVVRCSYEDHRIDSLAEHEHKLCALRGESRRKESNAHTMNVAPNRAERAMEGNDCANEMRIKYDTQM